MRVEPLVVRHWPATPNPFETEREPEITNAEVEAIPVTAKLVVVAFVPVAFAKVKFWSVVEPATYRSPAELIVVVAVAPK